MPVVTLALLAGCGGGGSGGASYDSSQAVAQKLGCTYKASDQSELFTSESGVCGEYTIAMFSGKEQRDSWLTAARQFGGNLVVGDNFVVGADRLAAAFAARDKVGGKVE